VQPVLGRVVVEGEQHLEVVGELVGNFRPLRAELGVEGLPSLLRVLFVLGLADLDEHVLREWLD